MDKGTAEIAKLADRLSKDPKSKLFVPLAEEYKKAGNIEKAIAVLTEGLKNNPGYLTAKSFLGRLLLDNGNLSEAQREFEEVIKAVPDSVLAQRKLGDIHALQGRTQEALHFFKSVLALNPKDPELKALVADIEAGRDVREAIAASKHHAAGGQTVASVVTPEPPSPTLPIPPVKQLADAVVQPKSQAAAVITPSVDAEEPEEVLVFELLDEAVPAGSLQQPEPAPDMFSRPVPEAGHENADRMDGSLTGEEDRYSVDADLSAEPPPVSGSDADIIAQPEHPLDTVTEHDSGSSEAVFPESNFFDSDSGSIQPASTETADASDYALESGAEASVSELTETESAALFFDMDTDVDTAGIDTEPQSSNNFDAGEEIAQTAAAVSETVEERSVSEDALSDSMLFDTELTVNAPLSVQFNDSGQDVSAVAAATVFDETLPDSDDFTTDTLAELYIAQGFYEKAIEIYDRMLADKPNSKLLKDKLANVRAMGSVFSPDQEQETSIFLETPGGGPPASTDGVAEWDAGPEAKEYVPPPPDDFESEGSDSDFPQVDNVLPEEQKIVLPSSVDQILTVLEEESLHGSPPAAVSENEQAIARLDNWLKNIIKEK